ncbi:hypothetical protein G6F31_012333 [Rhizopus arrhizus]|nr:hypothetical protein G6F31_012333 [Rhizopus arrhizus]
MDVSEVQSRTLALAQARGEAEQVALAKTHFLATMSHEIRTPMSTLLGMLERLADSDLDARQQQVLATVGDAARMLRQILDDVLHSQRLQPAPLQLRPTDLAAMLRAVQQLLMPVAASRGLHLRIELDPALQAGLLADGLRLRQILFNLAGNALKFTEHGSVDLQVRVLQQLEDGQRLRLQVSDSGVGISPERQQAVFAAYTQAEPSTTRRFGGSGLGLAICRELAASMGAELQLRSRPGEGTTVWMELDLAACERPAEASPPPAAAVPALPPAWVLVAEDHPTNLHLLEQRLRGLGLHVHACTDGRKALEAWQAWPFDLVITDCHMPDMDGFTLARAIRADACAARARVPIIALTASVLDRTREACRDAGIEHFLAKPAHDAGGSVAAFGHGGHHQVGATHRIAAGEQAWMRGLERQAVLATGHDAAVRPAFHAVLGQPRRQRRRETERDDHHVRFQQRFAALDRHGVLAAVGIGLAQPGLDHGHADHLVIGAGFDRQRLAVEQEAHALLARVGHLARAAGHVGLVAAVGAGDLGRAQPHRAAHAVHAGIAAAEHHHALAVQIGQGDGVLPAGNRPALRIIAADDAAVLHQERQRWQHALQVLAVQAAIAAAAH